MEMPVGEPAVDDFNRADFNNAVPFVVHPSLFIPVVSVSRTICRVFQCRALIYVRLGFNMKVVYQIR
jgi:hypothetical protein